MSIAERPNTERGERNEGKVVPDLTINGATPAANPPRLHLDYLDGLRALAALYVVAVHALSQVDRSHTAITGVGAWFAGLFMHGHYAVDLFIVLSGFCLALPVVRSGEEGIIPGGARKFFLRRAWRILPPYYLSMALTLLLIAVALGEKTGSSWDDYIPVTPLGIIAHLGLFHDAIPSVNAQINGVYWSIAVEWRIYFLFPLLIWAWRRVGPAIATALAILSGFLLMAALRPTPIMTHTNGVSLHYIGLFALGAFAAGIAYSSRTNFVRLREQRWWLWATLFSALLVVASSWSPTSGRQPLVPITVIDLFVGVTAACLLVFIAQTDSEHGLRRTLSWKPLVFIGTFAYSIYLIHSPFLQLFWQYGQVPLRLNLTGMLLTEAFIVFPATIALSYVFFLCCERPFLTRRADRIKAKAEQTTSEALRHEHRTA